MTRDERQQQFIDLFVSPDVNGRGTLEATPAFGKTRCAMRIIQYLRRTKADRKVIIVVPQHFLKRQWTEALSKDPLLIRHTEVVVINSLIKRTSIDCSLLVLDEIHRYASHTFSKVFEVVKYKFILGLTATMKRLDKKHKLITDHCPIIDRVTTAEAATNGWISPYMEFNLRVDLPAADLAAYLEAEEYYDNMMDMFAQDFGLMQKVSKGGIKPRRVMSSGAVHFTEPEAVRLARKRGWRGNTPFQAWTQMNSGVKDFWGGNVTHPFNPNKLHICAINGIRQLLLMKKIINNSEEKLRIAVELCNRIPVKAMTFSATIARTDTLTSMMGPWAVSYHSRSGGKSPKAKEASMKAMLADLASGTLRVVNTAKALDEGADFPDMRMGIRLEGTSSPTQHIQRRGRIVRFAMGKSAVMINLYLFGTRETAWLSNAQGYSEDIIWVDTIEELLDQVVVT